MREILQLCGLISEKGRWLLKRTHDTGNIIKTRLKPTRRKLYCCAGFTDEEGRRAILFGELFDIYRYSHLGELYL